MSDEGKQIGCMILAMAVIAGPALIIGGIKLAAWWNIATGCVN